MARRKELPERGNLPLPVLLLPDDLGHKDLLHVFCFSKIYIYIYIYLKENIYVYIYFSCFIKLNFYKGIKEKINITYYSNIDTGHIGLLRPVLLLRNATHTDFMELSHIRYFRTQFFHTVQYHKHFSHVTKGSSTT